MPIPTMLDFRRDNVIDHEGRTYNDWSGIRERLAKIGDRAVAGAFRDGLPENVVNAMLTQLANTRVKRAQGERTGVAPLDVLLGRHPAANSLTNTITVIPGSETEELLHLTDLNSGVPLSSQKEFRDAVHLGNSRLAEDKGIKGKMRNGKFWGMVKLTPTGNAGQLITEDPQSPNYNLGNDFFSAHGRGYEIANQIADFPRFGRDAASMKEAVPALIEMLSVPLRNNSGVSKIPYEYYPEAMEIVDKWADDIPYYEGEYGSKAVPHLRDVSTPK